MAGFLGIEELRARRQALVAESEVYRQLVRLEVYNLRLYAADWRRRAATLSSLNTALMLGLPLAQRLLRSQRAPKLKLLGLALLALRGWQAGRQLFPLLQGLLGFRHSGPSGGEPEANKASRAADA